MENKELKMTTAVRSKILSRCSTKFYERRETLSIYTMHDPKFDILFCNGFPNIFTNFKCLVMSFSVIRSYYLLLYLKCHYTKLLCILY